MNYDSKSERHSQEQVKQSIEKTNCFILVAFQGTKKKKNFPLKTKWHHNKLPKAEKPQVTILTQLVRCSKTHRFTDKLYSTLSASKATGRNKYESNSKSHNKWFLTKQRSRSAFSELSTLIFMPRANQTYLRREKEMFAFATRTVIIFTCFTGNKLSTYNFKWLSTGWEARNSSVNLHRPRRSVYHVLKKFYESKTRYVFETN